MKPTSTIRVGIVANEDSGDKLGATLLHSLRRQTDARIEAVGMGGPLMEQEGCRLLASVAEVRSYKPELFSSLRQMLALRRRLADYFLTYRPDVFIGLDAPDFNLPLARRLRASGIRTMQYVGPSIWYWRPGRVRQVARAVDEVLLLFPFEKPYYEKVPVRATVTGHPLVDELQPTSPELTAAAKRKFHLAPDVPVLGLMMGSRDRELSALTEDFLRTAVLCQQKIPALHCLVGLQSTQQAEFVQQLRNTLCPELPLTVWPGQAIDVMRAADALLLCSGTVTLEAMLLAKPMAVAYRMPRMLFYLYLLFLRLSWPPSLSLPPFSLPNIIAGRRLVPEFIQQQVCPSQLAPVLLRLLTEPAAAAAQRDAFIRLRSTLPLQASDQAARAVCRQLDVVSPRRRDEVTA